MGKWTSDIIEHLEARNKLVAEITKEVNSAINEISAALSGELEPIGKNIDVSTPRFDEKKHWTIKIGDCEITFDIDDVNENRTSQSAEGHRVFDESIQIGDAVRAIIKNKIKSN